MVLNRVLLRLGILPLIITGLISCSSFGIAIPLLDFGFGGKIAQLRQQQQNSLVSVTGKVTHLAPFLTGGAYQLEDDTGNIWVVTPESLPTPGSEIKVKAELRYESITIGDRDLGEFYLVELSTNSDINNNQSEDQMFFPHK